MYVEIGYDEPNARLIRALRRRARDDGSQTRRHAEVLGEEE